MRGMNADMIERAALSGELGYREIFGDRGMGELGVREIFGQGGGMNTLPTSEKELVEVSGGPWKIKLIGRRFPAIAAAATLQFDVTASQNFKIGRVIIPSEISPFFGVTQMTIGPEQMILGGEVPASSISEGALGAAVRFRTINLGVPLSVTIVNNDVAAHDFKLALIGIALD